MKRVAAKHAAQAASEFSTPTRVAKKLGRQIAKTLPGILKDKGLTVNVSEVFREGPFVVMQLKVLHVDPIVASEAKRRDQGKDPNEWIEWAWQYLGSANQQKIEADYCKLTLDSKS